MKRAICLIVALMLCVSMVLPVAAAEFVPSITYKDGVDFNSAELDGKDVSGQLVITPLKDILNHTADLPKETIDLMISLHEQLSGGKVKLPVGDGFVIRDMVHIGFGDNTEMYDKLNNTDSKLTVVFPLGVSKDTVVKVLIYIDGEWKVVEGVVNNGDGTVTVVFDQICPVLFCVDADAELDPPKTGDTMGSDLLIWIGVMAAALAAMVVLVINRRKFVR